MRNPHQIADSGKILQVSSWKRDLHRFQLGGLNILLDVNSGAVHLLDHLAWKVLDAIELAEGSIPNARRSLPGNENPLLFDEVLAEFLRLQDEGALFTSDASFPDYAGASSQLKSLCLHVAHDCNLRCSYCFAGKGSFGGERELMPFHVGQAAIDLLLEESQSRRFCEIDFFGGEPLMNFAVVRDLVSYGRERSARYRKEIRFTLTTNGTLLDEKTTAFLNREHIRVVLSIDGRPEVHDAKRPFRNGTGSYDTVLPRIRRFVDSRDGKDYYVRGTYTAGNIDFSKDVLHLVDLGFTEVSIEPVVAMPGEEFALTPADVPRLEGEYEGLAEALLIREEQGRTFNFYHFNLNLFHGPCLPRRLSGCGAGHEYLAVSPAGELYPCHQFAGQRQYMLGNVYQGITAPDLSRQFQQAHVYHKGRCRDCWARFYCSGGCHANNAAHNNDLLEPYEMGCALQKKRLECAIYLHARRSLKANA